MKEIEAGAIDQLDGADLAGLLRLAKLLNSTLDPEEVLRSIVIEVSRAVDVNRCSVVLIDPSIDEGHILASSDRQDTAGLTVQLQKYPEIESVLEHGAPVVVNDVTRASIMEPLRDELTRLGIRSLLVAPITSGDEIIGTIFLRSLLRAREFTSRDLQYCVAAADIAAVALRNAYRYRLLFAEKERQGELLRLETEKRATTARLASAEKRIAAGFHAAADMMALIDADGKFTQINRKTLEVSGYREDELLGRPFDQTQTPEEAQIANERLARAIRGEALAPREGILLTKSGQKIPIELTTTPIPGDNGEIVGVEVVARDIRERVGFRLKEQEMTKDLLETVAELRRKEEKLLEHDRLKTRFISSAAHELKTPITILKSYLETLMTDLAEGLSERQLSMLEVSWDSSTKLERLVADLLDLAALESGRLHLEVEPLQIEPILQRVIKDHESIARQADVQIRAELPGKPLPRGLVDEFRLEQVLVYLVANAVKFSNPGGEVVVGVEEEDVAIRIHVRDNGPGIAAEDQLIIFEEFARLSSASRKRPAGSGLGLALCRELVEALGGKIGVSSAIGEGASFHFTMPKSQL